MVIAAWISLDLPEQIASGNWGSSWSNLMKCLYALIGSVFLFGIAWAEPRVADAAELYGGYRTIRPMRVQPHREAVVGWRCPDRYSCSPLYGGATMPYGNPAYWSRYTMSGWAAY
jgi:hypothetical protein